MSSGPHRLLQKLTSSLGVVLSELGKEAFAFAIEHSIIARVEAKIENNMAMLLTNKAIDVDAIRDGLAKCSKLVTGLLEPCTVIEPISEKVHRMVSALRADSGVAANGSSAFCGMVFVSEVALAMPLAWVAAKAFGGAGGIRFGHFVHEGTRPKRAPSNDFALGPPD